VFDRNVLTGVLHWELVRFEYLIVGPSTLAIERRKPITLEVCDFNDGRVNRQLLEIDTEAITLCQGRQKGEIGALDRRTARCMG
jgi:hypothetical protein